MSGAHTSCRLATTGSGTSKARTRAARACSAVLLPDVDDLLLKAIAPPDSCAIMLPAGGGMFVSENNSSRRKQLAKGLVQRGPCELVRAGTKRTDGAPDLPRKTSHSAPGYQRASIFSRVQADLGLLLSALGAQQHAQAGFSFLPPRQRHS